MKTFYQLLANTIISSVTNYTVWFAIIFFGYLQTQSVLVTSIMTGIYLVATAITGFWFGELVDKRKKKFLLLASGIFSLVMYSICFIIYLIVGADAFKDVSNPVLWIFIIVLLAGVIAGNIRTIVLPVLVDKDKLDKANGLVGTAGGIAFLIVSVISGFLVGLGGMYWVLILAIILILVSTAQLWFIQIPEREIIHTENEEKQNKRIDIKGTLKVISDIPGLRSLILFTTINNFLGGVYMSLLDAYGLSLVSVQVWGVLWGLLSCAFIVGGIIIAKKGLGKNPLKTIFMVNILIWIVSSLFTIQQSIVLLMVGMFIYLMFGPFIEAAEHTVIQKVVPQERLGRVFGFAQSIEQTASPITAFAIGPITQLIFIPLMTTGEGARLIGNWYGIGPSRGIALVFTITGLIGLLVTIIAYRSKFYTQLSKRYLESKNKVNENLE